MTWWFVYSRPAFQKLKSQIEKAYVMLQKVKREGKKDDKRKTKLEREIKLDSAKLTAMRLYSMIGLYVVMLAVYQMMKSTYKGVVVAKLPFVPIPLFARLTHVGLDSNDMTDCGFVSLPLRSIYDLIFHFLLVDIRLHFVFLGSSCDGTKDYW